MLKTDTMKEALRDLEGKWVRIFADSRDNVELMKIIAVAEDVVRCEIRIRLTPRALLFNGASRKEDRTKIARLVFCETVLAISAVREVFCWAEDQTDDVKSAAPVLKMSP